MLAACLEDQQRVITQEAFRYMVKCRSPIFWKCSEPKTQLALFRYTLLALLFFVFPLGIVPGTWYFFTIVMEKVVPGNVPSQVEPSQAE